MSTQRVRFVPVADAAAPTLARFADPTPSVALLSTDAADFELQTLAADSTAPLPAENARAYVKLRGAELAWSPTHATLRCDDHLLDALTAETLAFTHYERALRQIETEIAASWPALAQDRPLAFAASPAALKRGDEIGARMAATFARRERLARLEPHLLGVQAEAPALARKLGEELRERTGIETRMEIADGHLEVFEHVYEMAAQRLGEFRASHGEHRLEWIIIVLLLAETLIMFFTRGH